MHAIIYRSGQRAIMVLQKKKTTLPLQALHLIVELQFHINTMASVISQHKFISSLKILVCEFLGGFVCLLFKSHIKGHFILYQWK